jgi:hypothetical protein
VTAAFAPSVAPMWRVVVRNATGRVTDTFRAYDEADALRFANAINAANGSRVAVEPIPEPQP